MSPKQKGKIEDIFTTLDFAEFGQSEVFRAIQADVDFNGRLAFDATGQSTTRTDPDES